MRCTTCHTELSKTGRFWVCPEHGIIQPGDLEEPAAATRPQTVFISYGRQDASAFAKRLAADLQERGGHKTFIDLAEIEKGGLWEVRIEQGIRNATVFAALMTPHSLRDSSVCRDEVVFALNEGKNVVPLRVDPNPILRPSLLLARRNWIDFSADYEVGFQVMLRYLRGDASALRPPALPTINGVVPLDFGPEIARFTADFTGREWVNPEIDHWLSRDNDRAMVIVAEPGVGKSAIAAWLTQTRDDVIGIHFCTQQNSRTRDPYEFVASLVGQLHARLPGFAEAVEGRHPEMRRATAADAFRELTIEVTRAMSPPNRARLIVVDSLDEALEQAGETVLDVLVQQAADLPTWLRLVATTRPEEAILHRIRTLNVFELTAERPENRADIRRYIQRRLGTPLLLERLAGENAGDVAAQLDVLSEGNYLYARMALDALGDSSIRANELTHLSPGLTRFFYETFRKRFPDTQGYERTCAPLMRALAAARGPLPLEVLQRVAGEAAEIVRRRLHDLRSYLRIHGQGEGASYAVYHRSLKDWLTNPEAAGAYWCQAKSGDRCLAALGWQVYADGKLGADEYFSRYLPEHIIGAGEWSKLAQLLADVNVFERIWEQGRKYEWMRYWQTLNGQSEPGACYEAALDKLVQNAVVPKRIARLSDIIGWFLRDMNLLSAAQPFTERALRVREEILGNDHADVADSVNNLAELFRAQRDFERALPLYQRALVTREKVFGQRSREVALSFHDLGEFYHDQKKYAEALAHYQRALEIHESALEFEGFDAATCLNDIGALYFEIDKRAEALACYRRALPIYERVYGPDHPDVAACLHNIALVCEDFQEAVPLCQRAFEILVRTFGPNHPKTQRCTKSLIGGLAKSGKTAEAVSLMPRIVEAMTQSLGSDHPDVAAALLEVASGYKGLGDFEKAAVWIRRAAALKQRTVGNDLPECVAVLEQLAWLLLGVRDYTEAVAYARRAVAIRKRISGPDHTDTATTLNTLLRCLQERGDHDEALSLCRQALAIREGKLPPTHSDIGTTLNNLGLSLVCLGQLPEAEQRLQRAVEINPGSPYPYYWLARLYKQRNQLNDRDREAEAWRQYLRIGPTSIERRSEAEARLRATGD
jgi:tetratricopeptide (TPR) repeat protein